LCGWWPILAADFTNDSKRSQASGANSISGFLGGGLGMIEAPYGVALDGDALAKLGGLCAVWSQFEFLIEITTYHLQKLDIEEGRTQNTLRDISRRLDALKILARKELSAEQFPIINDICERGAIAAQKRNLAVHGNWAFNVDTGKPAAISWFKVPFGSPLKVFHLDELLPLLTEAASLGVATRKFLELRGVLPVP